MGGNSSSQTYVPHKKLYCCLVIEVQTTTKQNSSVKEPISTVASFIYVTKTIHLHQQDESQSDSFLP